MISLAIASALAAATGVSVAGLLGVMLALTIRRARRAEATIRISREICRQLSAELGWLQELRQRGAQQAVDETPGPLPCRTDPLELLYRLPPVTPTREQRDGEQ